MSWEQVERRCSIGDIIKVLEMSLSDDQYLQSDNIKADVNTVPKPTLIETVESENKIRLNILRYKRNELMLKTEQDKARRKRKSSLVVKDKVELNRISKVMSVDKIIVNEDRRTIKKDGLDRSIDKKKHSKDN